MCDPDTNAVFLREWIFTKLWGSLQSDKEPGVILVGGPGAGKTTLCKQIVNPTIGTGAEAETLQILINQRLLGYYFTVGKEDRSLATFIQSIAEQIEKSLFLSHVSSNGNGNGHGGGGASATTPNGEPGGHTGEKKSPQAMFKNLITSPLRSATRPKERVLLIVDSIDDPSHDSSSCSDETTLAELLATTKLPSWVLLVLTARKQGKCLNRFPGYRKIYIDDLRKPQVVEDTQQYILSRLDFDPSLRQRVNRETLELLNQLHIKSNGCFLYLTRVLDGISDNFIALREVKEIPGTLFGLYLWMCQRLFKKRQFSKVKLIISLLVATKRPLQESQIYSYLQLRCPTMTKEDFFRRMRILNRVIIKHTNGTVTLFHHSFADWILDIKYCSQRFFCPASDGHLLLALAISMKSPLGTEDVHDICHHLLHVRKSSLDLNLIPFYLLSLGANVSPSQSSDASPSVNLVLQDCVSRMALVLPDSFKEKIINKYGNGTESEVCQYEGGGEAPCETSEEPIFKRHSNPSPSQGDQELAELLNEMQLKHMGSGSGGRGRQRPVELTSSASGHNSYLMNLFEDQLGNDSASVADIHGRTPLNLASRQGNIELVKAVLHRSTSTVDLPDMDGCTPLRSASWAGHTEVVASLLGYNASPLLSDNEGRTPLIAAAYMGHSRIVRMLLDAGADANHSDADGRSALSVAANRNHIKVVQLLLEKHANVNHRDKSGATPLIVAAFEGHKEICEILLEYGAEIDLADKLGRTSLWAAASMGHTPVADVLLFWGAYVDNIDGQGRTVLSVACAQGNVGVVRLLLERGLDEGHRDNSGWTPLHYAAFEGHQEVVEALLEYGAKVNEMENNGKHALIIAAEEGKMGVIQTLLRWNASLSHCSHDGRNAFRAAALSGFRDIAQLCLSRGVDINYRDTDGRSTLYILALESRIVMTQYLIKCGANVEVRDFEGRAPIHVSAWQGHREMTELLLSAGASVNALDNDKRTPLHSASWQGHHIIVRLLCERGANVDHACNQGATGLCIAAQEGHVECVRTLLEFGANPNQGSFGRTPIRVSLKSGHTAISKLLEAAIQKRAREEEENEHLNTKKEHKLSREGFIVENHHKSENAPDSPTYASPPQLLPTNSQLTRGKYRDREAELNQAVPNGMVRTQEPCQVVSENFRDERLFPSFAFSRDSHMKIILGSVGTSDISASVSKIKKNGLANGASVIRNGLNAIKSGVFEVTGRKHDSQLLVSAASMAVPNLLSNKAPAPKAPSGPKNDLASAKRETPL